MPGAFSQSRGAASFINAFLDQDEVEQRSQLDFLKTIAGSATTAQDIRTSQASGRRAEALFPGQLEQQGLTTERMELSNVGSGFANRQLARTEEQQIELDAIIMEKFGYPSFDVFLKAVDSGELDLRQRGIAERGRLGAPEAEAGLGVLQTQQTLQQAQAFGAGEGPANVGVTQAVEADRARGLAQQRLGSDLTKETVTAEVEAQRLAPALTRSEIFKNQAAAEASRLRGKSAATQKSDIERQAFIGIYGPEEGPIRYANKIVYGAEQEAGQRLTLTEIQRNISEIEQAIFRLELPETTDPMAVAMLAIIQQSNPQMFGDVSDEETAALTKDEIKALLMPRLEALDILHSEADPEGRGYLELTGVVPPGQVGRSQAGGARTGQPTYTTRDIDAAIGSLSSSGAGTTSFSSPQTANNSKNYLLKIMQSGSPDQWEVIHQVNRPEFIQRASEQDWNAVLEIIRQLSQQAPQAGAGGTQ